MVELKMKILAMGPVASYHPQKPEVLVASLLTFTGRKKRDGRNSSAQLLD